MDIYTNTNDEISKYIDSFNIVLADKDSETFKKAQSLYKKFKFINLNSSFAVNFILEYEKVDLVILSRKISNLSDIVNRAGRKKINVYILGKDIDYPINEKEIEDLILKEIKLKRIDKKSKWSSFKRNIFSFLHIAKKGETKSLDINKKQVVPKKRLAGSKKGSDLGCGREVYKKKDCEIDISKKEKVDEEKKETSNSLLKKQVLTMSPWYRGVGESENSEVKKIKTIKQKIIVISKAKGGVGSTTISIFLGFMLSKVKTLLVDLTFCEGGGDVSFYLDIPKSPNISNFIEGYNRDSLENSIVKIKDNLDVLQAPPTYEMSKKIDLQDIYCLSDIAKKKYHLIVFDLPNKFDDLLLGVIDLADLLVMVSDNTLGSIGRLLRMNNNFVYKDIEKLLIINKYEMTGGLNLIKQNIEQFLDLEDYVVLGENEILRNKSEFSNFNFSNIKSFYSLTEKIFSLLTYD